MGSMIKPACLPYGTVLADRQVRRLQIKATAVPQQMTEDVSKNERLTSGESTVQVSLSSRYPLGSSRSKLISCLSGSRASTAGPAEAFVRGRESAARQQLFGRIAPVYDQVGPLISASCASAACR